MSTKFNEAGFEVIEDEALIEYVAKGLFTGILKGGTDLEWAAETAWNDFYRNAAVDAIRAYREYERNNG